MHHTLHVDKSHQLGHAATTEHPAYGVLEYRDLLRVKLALGVFRTAPTNVHVVSVLTGVVVGERPLVYYSSVREGCLVLTATGPHWEIV